MDAIVATGSQPFLGNEGVTTPAASDQYFSDEQGIVAAFDFDYETIEGFQKQLQWAQFLCLPPLWASCVCCYPCYLNQNVEWKTRAQHVALTIDGIRYVKERHQRFCGLPCSDVGKESKTVPYDKITDCDVREPAGTACCCCIPNVLAVVQIDTASSGGTNKEGLPRHELELKGLRFANEFKKSVWAMKRGVFPQGANVPLQAGVGLAAPAQTEMIQMSNALLGEIRDELRELNARLREKGAAQ